MALSGKVGGVFTPSGASAPQVGLAMTADATYKVYTVTNSGFRLWDKDKTITVKKNAVIQTGGFSIDFVGGVVTFTTALVSTDAVTVDASCFNLVQVGGMFNWKADLQVDVQDTTTFASGGFKEFTPVLKGFSGSAEQYWGDATFFNNVAAGADLILVLYVDAGANKYRYDGYVQFNKDGMTVNTTDLISESIDFTGDGTLSYRAG